MMEHVWRCAAIVPKLRDCVAAFVIEAWGCRAIFCAWAVRINNNAPTNRGIV
jgi:hypothetical protein